MPNSPDYTQTGSTFAGATDAEQDARYQEQCLWCGQKFDIEESGVQIDGEWFCCVECAALSRSTARAEAGT